MSKLKIEIDVIEPHDLEIIFTGDNRIRVTYCGNVLPVDKFVVKGEIENPKWNLTGGLLYDN